jgi:F-type H+-transporting ATPase subunit b
MEFLHNLGIDPRLVLVQVVGFLIFLAIMKRLVYKPIFGILEERQADIKSTYDQLDADREAMAKTRKEYEDRLAGIEAQAREKIQTAVKEAQELRASIIADAQKQAQAVIDSGRADLDRERVRTFSELRGQIADLAILAAGKALGESIDDARQRKLVDQFIATAGEAPSARNGVGVA